MVSPSTKEDMAMTTGNSDDVRMVPSPEPTCGIPIEYRRGEDPAEYAQCQSIRNDPHKYVQVK